MMKTLRIDLSNNTLDDYYRQMEQVFGFPSWWGRNWHAMFDCLSTLRGPAEGKMTSFLIGEEDKIILEVVNTEMAKFDLNLHLFAIIGGVNQFFRDLDGHSIILLDINDGFTYLR